MGKYLLWQMRKQQADGAHVRAIEQWTQAVMTRSSRVNSFLLCQHPSLQPGDIIPYLLRVLTQLSPLVGDSADLCIPCLFSSVTLSVIWHICGQLIFLPSPPTW